MNTFPRQAWVSSIRATLCALGFIVASLTAASAQSCAISYLASVTTMPESHIKHASLIVSGRALEVETSEVGDLSARLEIYSVFKGQAPRMLQVRVRAADNPCSQIMPPTSEPFVTFLRAEPGNLQSPSQIGFVRQSALPADFARRLGRARAPRDILTSRGMKADPHAGAWLVLVNALLLTSLHQ